MWFCGGYDILVMRITKIGFFVVIRREINGIAQAVLRQARNLRLALVSSDLANVFHRHAPFVTRKMEL
jgi:hypothetical protein